MFDKLAGAQKGRRAESTAALPDPVAAFMKEDMQSLPYHCFFGSSLKAGKPPSDKWKDFL
jgi:hypothetical protein